MRGTASSFARLHRSRYGDGFVWLPQGQNRARGAPHDRFGHGELPCTDTDPNFGSRTRPRSSLDASVALTQARSWGCRTRVTAAAILRVTAGAALDPRGEDRVKRIQVPQLHSRVQHRALKQPEGDFHCDLARRIGTSARDD